MKPPAWRVMTLAYGAAMLVLALATAYAGVFLNGTPGFSGKAASDDLGALTVTKIDRPDAIRGRLAVGDVVRIADASFANRAEFQRERPGDRFAFVRTAPDGSTSRFTDTIVYAGPMSAASWSLLVMPFAFVLVGMTIAARRPEDHLTRLLVGLFFSLATVLLTGPLPMMPVWLLVPVLVLHLFAQVFVAYAALALAVSFPRRSTAGFRRALDRANPLLLALCLAVLCTSFADALLLQRRPPAWVIGGGIALTLVYYAAVAVAFVLARRGVDVAERKRLQWVAWTLAAGFSGEFVLLAFIALRLPLSDAMTWLNLTLLAIPFGMAYAILRHRVIDIGFVVNRALVFGTVSAVVLLAFGALEWLLGNVLVRVSHLTGATLELTLALALGFALRGIHARAERFIDDLFFRARHEADRALRAFARDVAYIGDPRVAVERTYDELAQRTGAVAVAIYVVDAPNAARVDLGEGPGPALVDLDDPALVRLRATRAPLALRECRSALAGDRAFPMCVRDGVTGVVVLGPKTSGEAYAPDEIDTIDAVVLALGAALDALHTAALKAELTRVLMDGAPLEALRRTADPAAWVLALRGGTQPAGSLSGLIE